MADGEVVGRSEVLNSLLDQSSRLGALEQVVEERPSFKQLMDSNNELRREISKFFEKGLADLTTNFSAQIENLKLTMGNQQAALIEQAVNKALERQRLNEAQAREDIKNKAQDTVQGVQLFVKSQGWLNVILLIALIVMGANQYWKFF